MKCAISCRYARRVLAFVRLANHSISGGTSARCWNWVTVSVLDGTIAVAVAIGSLPSFSQEKILPLCSTDKPGYQGYRSGPQRDIFPIWDMVGRGVSVVSKSMREVTGASATRGDTKTRPSSPRRRL